MIRFVVVVLAGVCVVSACQEATTLGAINRCGEPIDAFIEDIRFPVADTPTWRFRVQEQDIATVEGLFTKDPEELFVWARLPGEEVLPEPVRVPEANIERGIEGEEYEWLVTIDGELCPP